MIKIVILAAGRGTRMNHDLPKLLVPINNKPIIEHLAKAIISSGVDKNPIVVVSPDNEELTRRALAGYDCQYAIQQEQLGTGHAFACALNEIKEGVDHVLSFYGDHPLVRPETIKNLASHKNGVLTMMTTVVPDFEEWRHNFYHWGRIVRRNGRVEAIVEFKDAPEEIRSIREVNPGFYCFEYAWLKGNINKLKNENVQKEYYITDLVQIAFNQGIKIDTFAIDPKEAIGINSKEELEVAQNLINKN